MIGATDKGTDEGIVISLLLGAASIGGGYMLSFLESLGLKDGRFDADDNSFGVALGFLNIV